MKRSGWQVLHFGASAVLLAPMAAILSAQQWDIPARAADWTSLRTEGKLKVTGEIRGRYERRTGQAFGRDPDVDTGLVRNRLSVSVKPVAWLRFAGALQDSRAPGYGPDAPSSARDEVDWLEGYVELFPDAKKGFGMTAGRMMRNYGETRLLATPQWGNVTRSYDHARLYWRDPRAQVEFLFLSPVKARPGRFNRPVLGERVWGTYNSLPDLFGKNLVEIYVLRHDQNYPGGFAGGSKAAGTNRLGTNTIGGRMTGPLSKAGRYGLEAAFQTGKVGPARHRAAAGAGWLSRRWTLARMPLELTGEYKYASGTRNPQDTSRVGTFDQLFPSPHDKLGHMDLLGWRNLHNAKSLGTLGVTRELGLNVMYNSWWLASKRDGLYNTAGRLIAGSASGAAGRHVGQEIDVFGTCKYQRLTFGVGFGRMFAGEVVRKATPGVEPLYAYVFHTYAF